jgi:hypothetical protein
MEYSDDGAPRGVVAYVTAVVFEMTRLEIANAAGTVLVS